MVEIRNKAFLINTQLSIKPTGKMVIYKQQGVVLVVALVFLIALTGVAAALMQNTTSDMKMAGASNEKVVATQAAVSAVDEVINNQVKIQAINVFTKGLEGLAATASADLLPVTTDTDAVASANVINNPLFDEFACPRSMSAFSVGIIECNFLQLQIQRPYGRSDTSAIVVNTSIAQQLLPNN